MNELNKNRLTILLLFLLYLILLPRDYMVYDFQIWENWAIYIHQHGLTNAYDNNFMVDYHPIYLYAIWVYDLIQGNEHNIIANINYIKLFPLLFDFLPIVVLCCFRQNLIKHKIPFLLLLLNIAYIYNSIVWGQIDSVHSNLSFLAILVSFTNPILSGFLFAFALCTKLQAIIYLPILVIGWVYSIKRIKTVFLLGVVISATTLLLCLPFIITGHTSQLVDVVTTAVGRYPTVSVSGYNIWYLLYWGDPNHKVDTDTFFILSYKNWGLLLFFLSSGVTLLAGLFYVIRSKIVNAVNIDDLLKMMMLTGGLITLYFFYFNTQMHERYAHTAVIFFFFYGVFSKNYWLYILVSISYLLSLEKSFHSFFPIEHFKIIFASRAIAVWYSITLGVAIYEFAKQYKPIQEYRLLKEAFKSR